jgi:hypothetical protein
MPGCLHVRQVRGQWRAVFRGSPAVVEQRLRSIVIPQEGAKRPSVGIGLSEVTCTSVPLEELFVDLLGGEPLARVS